MTRILVNLTALNLVALTATFGIGWLSFLSGGRANEADPTYTLHIYLALISVTTTLGLHCLVFIYFLGTGRWVKEVSLAYGLTDYHPLPTLTRELKRRAFPAALFAMLVPIGASAAGAGVATLTWPWLYHALLAVATLGVNVWAFFVEFDCVRRNGAVIDGTMREVDRVRAERGLPTNAEALREQEQVPG
jgi:hypothetical protein